MSFETVFDHLVDQWMDISAVKYECKFLENPHQDILIGVDCDGILVGGKNDDLLTDRSHRPSVPFDILLI